MKKKILMKGPFLSLSGYGYQARFALDAMRANVKDDEEIFILNTGWGKTSWLTEDDENRQWIDDTLRKTHEYIGQGGQFDINLQIAIPNELEQNAPFNILYTAGIETTHVSGEWLKHVNDKADKVIVVSNHSKEVFEKSSYDMMNKDGTPMGKIKCDVPIDVVNYSVKDVKPAKLDLKFDTDFNFLAVAQWSPRKNVENLVRWFYEEFWDMEVGLVLKISMANNCLQDRFATERKLKALISNLESGEEVKCRVYMVHGHLTDSEMRGLYDHPQVKSFITLTHGEGFGLPIFEAAQMNLPIIAPGWSGQNDFLYDGSEPLFQPVDFDIAQIQPEAVWKGILEEHSKWCYPKESSSKMKMRYVYKNYDKATETSRKLRKYVNENFTEDKMYKKFYDSVMSAYSFTDDEIEDWLDTIEVHGDD